MVQRATTIAVVPPRIMRYDMEIRVRLARGLFVKVDTNFAKQVLRTHLSETSARLDQGGFGPPYGRVFRYGIGCSGRLTDRFTIGLHPGN